MVDKSWGVGVPVGPRIRTNLSLEERAEARARARDERVAERKAAIPERFAERAAARDALAQEREAARVARREAEQKLAVEDPHTAAAQRRRGSGRKDIVREDRDTTGYAMIVDAGRIRALAARGASVESLAAVFSLPVEEIERVLVGKD